MFSPNDLFFRQHNGINELIGEKNALPDAQVRDEAVSIIASFCLMKANDILEHGICACCYMLI